MQQHPGLPAVGELTVTARARIGLLVAAVAVVATGCTSSTGGTADFQKPSCSGDHAIKAADKSFCFILPPKLRRSEETTNDNEVDVEIDANNIVEVEHENLDGNVSSLSNEELLDRFSEALAKESGGERLDTDSGRVFYTAIGRALGYNGTAEVKSGTAKIEQNVVFHGSSMLQVICVWTDHEKEIRSACVDVLRSAQITDG